MAAAIISAVMSPTYGRNDTVSFLIQQTPPNGGYVTPDIGVHRMAFASDVKITAVPKPGYQFVYWLGDVVDPTSSSTIVHLDGPKIVIAVFERVSHEFLIVLTAATSRPAHGLIPRRREGGKGGAVTSPPPERDEFHVPQPPQSDDFPVPEPPQDDDFPVPEPIPEPATVLLMTLGALFATRNRKYKTSRIKT